MFSFFKKKEPTANVKDVIWLSEMAKLNALAKAATENPQTVFITWFDDTFDKIQSLFTEKELSVEHLYLANKTWRTEAANNPVIFAEHYPLPEKEDEFYHYLGLQSATVYTSLDEPFLKMFGGDKLINLMQKMGAKEDESIEHSMVSASIRKAQEKIRKKVAFESSARSQEEWMQRNVN